jgi:Leucine-rich repeat (LRR) protein
MRSFQMPGTTRFFRIALLMAMLCCMRMLPALGQNNMLLDSLSLDTLQAYTDLNEALKNPDKVLKLVLRKQKLKEFPAAILQFKNLQYLDLSKNSIRELPPEIAKLQSLQYFSISRNSLEGFIPELGELVQLRWLIMNQNELSLLPPQIGKLVNLEYLDLWSNNLDHLPDDLRNLKNLKRLDLRVIMINDQEQSRIAGLLPNTKIFFSANCNCKN